MVASFLKMEKWNIRSSIVMSHNNEDTVLEHDVNIGTLSDRMLSVVGKKKIHIKENTTDWTSVVGCLTILHMDIRR